MDPVQWARVLDLAQVAMMLTAGILMWKFGGHDQSVFLFGCAAGVTTAALPGGMRALAAGGVVAAAKEVAGKTAAVLLLVAGGILFGSAMSSGCATVKAVAMDCAPIPLATLEQAAEMVGQKLEAQTIIRAEDFEQAGLALAAKLTWCVLTSVARHLLEQLDAQPAQLASLAEHGRMLLACGRGCHHPGVGEQHRAFLLYLIARGSK